MTLKEDFDRMIVRVLEAPEPIDIQFVSQEAYHYAWETGELIDSLKTLIEVCKPRTA